MKKLLCAFFMLMLIAPVWADGKYSIKQMTPQVQEALNNRRDRFEQLRSLKTSGDIGESNQGYVEALKHGAADGVVSAENHDRQVIYQTIADQNGLSGSISTIEHVFAQVQRDKAQGGDKIQGEDGAWVSI